MNIPRVGTQHDSFLLKARLSSNDLSSSKLPSLPMTSINRFNESRLNDEFDLIVIGGGINGAGIARDASERGLKVLLLEKEDFGAGCTAASTRIKHGGLRYLEHFEFGLVKESLAERKLSLKNENHLVKPLEFHIPIYKTDKRGYFLIKLGMLLYDFLSYDKSLPWHKMYYGDTFKNIEPAIESEGLVGGAVFHDAQVSFPERVCLENILMARQNGAIVLNHAEVTKINLQNNEISSLEFFDHLQNKKFTAKSKSFVNASGPWLDNLCSLVGKNIDRKISGTKGSHLVVKQFPQGPKHALLLQAKSDGRPFFIIPWQEYYLIGTTDISFNGDLNHVRASTDEVNYLIEESNKTLKHKKLSKEDILFTYSGIRPLPYTAGSTPASITRRHLIFDHKDEGVNNLFSIIGGKLTTYRLLAEQTVNLIYNKIGYDFVKTKTRTVPLLGAVEGNIEEYKNEEIKSSKKKHMLDSDITAHLIDLYGKRYTEVLHQLKNNKELGYLLSSHNLDIRAQIDYAISAELAYTITDILLRRLSLGLSEGLGEDAIDYTAGKLKQLHNYTDSQINNQKQNYQEWVLNERRI